MSLALLKRAEEWTLSSEFDILTGWSFYLKALLFPFSWTLDLTTRQTVWNMSSGFLIMWTSYVGLNQSCIQSIVSVPTIKHAKR